MKVEANIHKKIFVLNYVYSSNIRSTFSCDIRTLAHFNQGHFYLPINPGSQCDTGAVSIMSVVAVTGKSSLLRSNAIAM